LRRFADEIGRAVPRFTFVLVVFSLGLFIWGSLERDSVFAGVLFLGWHFADLVLGAFCWR
jgi:hypothetical protein